MKRWVNALIIFLLCLVLVGSYGWQHSWPGRAYRWVRGSEHMVDNTGKPMPSVPPTPQEQQIARAQVEEPDVVLPKLEPNSLASLKEAVAGSLKRLEGALRAHLAADNVQEHRLKVAAAKPSVVVRTVMVRDDAILRRLQRENQDLRVQIEARGDLAGENQRLRSRIGQLEGELAQRQGLPPVPRVQATPAAPLPAPPLTTAVFPAVVLSTGPAGTLDQIVKVPVRKGTDQGPPVQGIRIKYFLTGSPDPNGTAVSGSDGITEFKFRVPFDEKGDPRLVTLTYQVEVPNGRCLQRCQWMMALGIDPRRGVLQLPAVPNPNGPGLVPSVVVVQ